MNPWPFIIGAYAITLGATILTTLLAMRAARAAEARAEERPGRN